MLNQSELSSCVYFIYSHINNVVKIGTTNNKNKRYRSLKMMSSTHTIFVGSIAGSYEKECSLHREFYRSRVHGEWFNVDQHLNSYLVSLFGEDWKIKSVEDMSITKDILFTESIIDRIISFSLFDNQKSNIRYCDCKYIHHVLHREQQIRNMRANAIIGYNKSFERSEERRELIMPILKKDDDMVTIDAIAKLDYKSRRRKAA